MRLDTARLERRLWWLFGARCSSPSSSSASSAARCTARRRRSPSASSPPTAACSSRADDILTGQQVWQSTGGQQLGSIWGHGAYQAPDWSADWLHREAMALLDVWAAREHGAPYAALDAGRRRRVLRARLEREMRTQHVRRRRPARVTCRRDRAEAMRAHAPRTTTRLFGGAPDARASCARRYAHAGRRRCPTPARRATLTTFFFWTSWACGDRAARARRSPTRTTGRTSRSIGNRPDRAPTCCGRSSASCCCWPASARSSGGTRSAAADEPAVEPPARDPLGGVALDAVDARRRQVRRRRRRAVRRAGAARRADGALHRRGPGASSASRSAEYLPYA